jgi:DNA-binding winged helix-turn-helix (wHTH) protein
VASVVSFSGPGHPLLERLEVVFDADSRTLERGGRRRHLAPREAGVLAALLRSEAGQVIPRSDLLDAVWGDGEVCEDALTVIVSRLRRHFDRLGIGEPVIETVPRRGYRLGQCRDETGGWREARRDGRLARSLGLSALVLSASALVIASLALVLALP